MKAHLQIGWTDETCHDAQFILRPVPGLVFMSEDLKGIRNGGLIQVVVEPPEGSSNTGYAAAMDEFIDRALEAEATHIEDVRLLPDKSDPRALYYEHQDGVRLELEYPLAKKPGEEWGREERERWRKWKGGGGRWRSCESERRR